MTLGRRSRNHDARDAPDVLYRNIRLFIVLPTVAWEASVSQDLAIQVTVGSSGSCQGNAGCVPGLAWISFYNDERQHQSLGYRTPRRVYQEGLWICGRSASPPGCASPASRASSESGECSPSPTYPQAPIRNAASSHLKERLRLSHVREQLRRYRV
jgi:hypothetical protein